MSENQFEATRRVQANTTRVVVLGYCWFVAQQMASSNHLDIYVPDTITSLNGVGAPRILEHQCECFRLEPVKL